MKKEKEHQLVFLMYQIFCILFFILGLFFVISARFPKVYGLSYSINLMGFGFFLILLSFITFYLMHNFHKTIKIEN